MKITKFNISKRRKFKYWIELFQNNNKFYYEDDEGFWRKSEYNQNRREIYRATQSDGIIFDYRVK